MAKKRSALFQLEALEPRVMLSGEALGSLVAGPAIAPLLPQAGSVIQEELSQPLPTAIEICYDPATRIEDIFAGSEETTPVASPTEAESEATSDPESASGNSQPTGRQNESATLPAPDADAALNPKPASTPVVSDGAGNPFPEQLTETLRSANGPPDAGTTDDDDTSAAANGSSTSPSQSSTPLLLTAQTAFSLAGLPVPALGDLLGLIEGKLFDYLNGVLSGEHTVTLPDVQLGEVFQMIAPTLVFKNITFSGSGSSATFSGTVELRTDSASFNAGSTLSATVTDGPDAGDSVALSGAYSLVNARAKEGTFTLAADRFDLAIADFASLGADGLTVVYETLAGGDTRVKLGATGVSAFLGTGGGTPGATGVQVSSGELLLGIFRSGANPSTFALDTSGAVALLGVPDLTLSGTAAVRVNTTGTTVNETITVGGMPKALSFMAGEENQRHIEGSLTLDIAGFVSLDGTFAFDKSVSGMDTKILAAATGVDAFLGANGTGVEVTGAGFGLALFKTGMNPATYALEASGTVSLLGVPNLTLTGTAGVRVNTTGVEVNESISIDGMNRTVAFGMGEENLQHIEGTGVELAIAGFVSLTGNFAFEKTVTGPQTKILVGASAVNAFLGANAGTPEEVGVKVTGAELGVVIYKTGMGASTYALEASGTVALVGVPNLTLLGTLGVRANNTLGAVNETITVGEVTKTISFTMDEGNFQHFEGMVTLNIADFVSLEGTFAFEKRTEMLNATTTRTTLLVGAVGVSAFLGVDEGTPDETGVRVTGAQLGLVIYKTVNTAPGSMPQPSKYALTASGGIEIVGLPMVEISGTVGVKTNQTGQPVNETITTSAGNVDIVFTSGDAVQVFQGAPTLTFGDTLTIEGSFTITRTPPPMGSPMGTKPTLRIDIEALTFTVTVDGTEYVKLGGSISFQVGGRAAAMGSGFRLLSVGITSVGFLGNDLADLLPLPGAAPAGEGEPAATPPPAGIALGPLLLTTPSVSIGNFSFDPSGQLTLTVTITVMRALLNNGMPGAPITADVRNLAGSFDVNINLVDGLGVQPGDFSLTASLIEVGVSTFLKLRATGFALNPGAGPSEFAVEFREVTAEVSVAGLTIGGTARNFAFEGDGDFVALPFFGVELSLGTSPGSLKWPDWLPIRLTRLGLQWPDFNTAPTDFRIILSASADIPARLPSGFMVSGLVENVVIDLGLLEEGKFPIIDIGAVGVSVSGNLFGGQVTGTLIIGIAKFGFDDRLITSPAPDVPVKDRVFYAGIRAGFSFGGLTGFTIQLGFTENGPLSIYVSAGIPVLLEPITGLTITNFRGGVSFNSPLPDITDPLLLRSPVFNPPLDLTDDQWLVELKRQVVAQYVAGGGEDNWGRLLENMRIDAGATLYTTYTSTNVFRADIDIIISTDGKFLINARAVFGNSLSLGVKLYANLTQVNEGRVTVLFLIDMPAPDPMSPIQLPPIVSIFGSIFFKFVDANGNDVDPKDPGAIFQIEINGTARFSALGFAVAEVTGQIVMSFEATRFQVDLTGRLSITGVGDVLAVAGRLVINDNAGDIEFWGVLRLDADFDALSSAGLEIQAKLLMQLNTTGTVKNETITLPGQSPEMFALEPMSFRIQVNGDAVFRRDGAVWFQVSGLLDLEITPEGLRVYLNVTLSVGPGGTTFMEFMAVGFLSITGDGLAATLTLDIVAPPGNSLGLDFSGMASLTMQINTTAQEVTYTVPVRLQPFLQPGQSASIVISAGAPRRDGSFAAPGPYFLIFGDAQLELLGQFTLDGSFRFLITPSVFEADIDVMVGLESLGSLRAVGMLTIDSDGLLASIQLGGGTGESTSANGLSLSGYFRLEINTTQQERTLTRFVVDRATGTVNFGQTENVVIEAETVRVFVGGALQLTGSFAIRGTFEMTVRTGFLDLRVDATVTLDFLGSLVVSGQLTIQADDPMTVGVDESGMLASLVLVVDAGGLASSGITLSGLFLLEINTFTSDKMVERPEVTITEAGDVVVNQAMRVMVLLESGKSRVFVAGSLQVGTSFTLKGRFEIAVSATSLEIEASAVIDLSFLGTMTANGFLLVNGDGVVAAVELSFRAGRDGDFDGALGFTLTGTFTFEVNTTGSAKMAPLGMTMVTVNPGVRVTIEGALQLAGSFHIEGRLIITISPSLFSIEFDATVSVLDFDLTIRGFAKIYGDGIVFSISLTLGGGGEVTYDAGGIFTIKGSFEMQINTTGQLRDGVRPGLKIAIRNVELSLLGVLTLSGSAIIEVSGSEFMITVPQSDPLTVDFFGVASLSVYGFFSSTGDFSVTLNGYFQIGSNSFGIRGGGTLHVSYINSVLNLSGSAFLEGRLFGITIASLSVGFEYNSLSGRIRVSVTISINLLFFSVEMTATFNIGFLKLPPPVYLAERMGDGTLVLNMGPRAGLRNIETDVADEFFLVSHVSGSAGDETVLVEAMGRKQRFNNVSRIFAQGSDGNDYIEIGADVLSPVELHGGDGSDQIFVHHALGAVITGGAGVDQLTGGSGDDQIDGGADADILSGGAGADTIHGRAGGDVIDAGQGLDTIYGEDDDDSFTWRVGDGTDTLVDGGAGNDAFVAMGTNADETVTITRNGATFDVDFAGVVSRPVAIEGLTVDGGAGADTFLLRDTTGSILSQVTFNLGRVPGAETHDGAADRVQIDGTASADTYSLVTSGGVFTVFKQGGLTTIIERANAAAGDALTLSTLGGNDQVDASQVSQHLLQLTLEGGANNDTLLGTPFADVLDGGDGNDTFSGGFGVDVFHDGSGAADKLVERLDANFALTDTTFRINAELESLLDGMGNALFESVELFGGTGDNQFTVSNWTGVATLDGQEGSDTYTISFLGSGAGRVTINDSGTGLRGYTNTNVMILHGSAGNDEFLLRAGLVQNGDDAHQEVLNYAGVSRLTLNGGNGGDSFVIDEINVAAEINGDSGADSFVVGRILAPEGDPAPVGIETVDTTRGFLSIGNRATLTVRGGSGDDYFEVNHNPAELFLFGDAGDDLFLVKSFLEEGSSLSNVNGGTGLNLIRYVSNGAVNIDGGEGFDRLIVEGTEADDIFVITDRDIFGVGRRINFVNIEGIVVAGDLGNDVFYVLSTGLPLTILGGSGDDTVYVGGQAPDYIYTPPPVTVDPPAQTVQVPIYSAPRDVTVLIPGYWYIDSYALPGLPFLAVPFGRYQPPQIITIHVPSMIIGYNTMTIDPPPTTTTPPPETYRFKAVNTFTGVANGVEKYVAAGSTPVTPGPGVTPTATFNLPGLQAPVNFIGGDDTGRVGELDRLIVVNTGETANTAGTLGTGQRRTKNDDGTFTVDLFGQLRGLGLPGDVTIAGRATAGGITFDGLERLDLKLGFGSDALDIENTFEGFTLDVEAGAGNDTLRVRNAALRLEDITGPVSIHGQGGSDSLLLDDSGEATGQSGVLTNSRVTGFGMGAPVNYDLIETLTLNLGAGGDTLDIQSTPSGTTTTVNGNDGDDTVNVRNAASRLDDIAGPLVLHGNGGFDVLNLDDSGDTNANTGRLTATFLDGLDMGGSITYTTFGRLNLSLGTGADTLTVFSTHGNEADVTERALAKLTFVTGGSGDDNFFVGNSGTGIAGLPAADLAPGLDAIADVLDVDGLAGNDILNLNDRLDTTHNTGRLLAGRLTDPSRPARRTNATVLGFDMPGEIGQLGFETMNLLLGTGNDRVLVEHGDAATEFVNLFTGGGDDRVEFYDGQFITGLLNGESGARDTVDYARWTGSIRADLIRGRATGINLGFDGGLRGVEDAVGGAGRDFLIGNELDNWFAGNASDDVLTGNGGHDVLDGGAGNDALDGGAGNDSYVLVPGSEDLLADSGGLDTLNFASATMGITLDLRLDRGQSQIIDAAMNRLALTGVFENVLGSTFDDTITGNDADNSLAGGPGNDHLLGWRGNDQLFGDDGSDLLEGGLGDDILRGGPGADELRGDDGADQFFGDDDPDVLRGGAGDDEMNGGPGDDQLFGDSGDDVLSGDEDFDALDGGSGARDLADYSNALAGVDVNLVDGAAVDGLSGFDLLSSIEGVIGSDFNDFLFGNDSANFLYGRAGDDFVFGAAGDDYLEGGAGIDTVASGSGNDRLSWTPADGIDYMEGDAGFDVATFNWIGAGDDVVIVSSPDGSRIEINVVSLGGLLVFSERVEALEFNFSGGNDRLEVVGLAGTGVQRITADLGEGDDMLIGAQVSGGPGTVATVPLTVSGGPGNDVFYGGAGRDVFMGDDGFDTVDYSRAPAAVIASLPGTRTIRSFNTFITVVVSGSARADGHGSADGILSMEELVGSPFNDRLAGNNLNDVIRGGGGNDLIYGYAGNDRLHGDDGLDTLRGGTGDDFLFGGGDNDTLLGEAGLDSLDGGAGADTLRGGAGNDRLLGGADNDLLWGDGGFDTYLADLGNDTYRGGAGDWIDYSAAPGPVLAVLSVPRGTGSANDGFGTVDTLIGVPNIIGSPFADTLTGTPGANQIRGGPGNDMLHGAAGNDTFLWHDGDGDDVITGGGGRADILRVTGSDFQPDDFTLDSPDGVTTRVAGTSSAGFTVLGTGLTRVELFTGADDDVVAIGPLNGLKLALVTVNLGDGSDFFNGQASTVPLSVLGGAGGDVLLGGLSRDLLDGGADYDRVDYSGATAAIVGAVNGRISHVGQRANVDTLRGFEEFVATPFNDRLSGSRLGDVIFGLGGDDIINAGHGPNVVDGGAGNDVVRGGNQRDVFYGREGNDQLFGGAGPDSLHGNAGNDLLDGGRDRDVDFADYSDSAVRVLVNLADGSGRDDSDGSVGVDRLVNIDGVTGSDFNDVLTGNDRDNHLDGRLGNDQLNGAGGRDRLVDGQGNDALDGGAGDDEFVWTNANGGMGTFTVTDTAGSNRLLVQDALGIAGQFGVSMSGGRVRVSVGGGQAVLMLDGAQVRTLRLETGAGSDNVAIADLSASGLLRVEVILGEGDDTLTAPLAGVPITAEGGAGIDVLSTGTADDVLSGGDGDDLIFGDGGNDRLLGNAGDDELDGGTGDDHLEGGDGDDLLTGGDGDDRLDGGRDDDTYALPSGNDTVVDSHGAGDVLDFSGADEGVTVDLSLRSRQTLDLAGNTLVILGRIDNVIGSDFDDVITGNADRNEIQGGFGDDQINGGAGDDELDGEDGDDVLSGGLGNDELRGGDGNDELNGDQGDDEAEGGAGDDLINGGLGNDELLGDADNDTLNGDAGNDYIDGFDGDDLIDAGAGSDVVDGGTGDDEITGGPGDADGNDLLIGWSGDDTIDGGAGDDVLFGDDGDDILVGGPGADIREGGAGSDTLDPETGEPDEVQQGHNGFQSVPPVLPLFPVRDVSFVVMVALKDFGPYRGVPLPPIPPIRSSSIT